MFMKDKRRSKLLSIKDLTQEFYKKEKILKKLFGIQKEIKNTSKY